MFQFGYACFTETVAVSISAHTAIIPTMCVLRREHRKSNGIDIESWQDVTVANCAVYCGDAPPMEVRCNWSLQSQLEEDTTNVSD